LGRLAVKTSYCWKIAIYIAIIIEILVVVPAGADEKVNCDVQNLSICTMPPMNSGADFYRIQQIVSQCCCPPNCDKKKKKKKIEGVISEVCPPLPGVNTPSGVIAANDESKALVTYQGTPDTLVGAWLEGKVPGGKVRLAAYHEPHSDAQYLNASRKEPLQVKTDGYGFAKVILMLRVKWYYPETGYKIKPLDAPAEITVFLQEVGKNKRVASTKIQVGLGVKLVEGKLLYHPANPNNFEGPALHVWRTVVKSRFHAKLDLLDYYESIAQCNLELHRPLVNVQSINITPGKRGEKLPLDDGIGGIEEIVPPNSNLRKTIGQVMKFARDPKGNVYLAPAKADRAKQQQYRHGKYAYPAVLQETNGRFMKGYFGFLKIAQQYRATHFSSQPSLEPRVFDHLAYVFSKDSPDSYYTLALCMFEAQDVGQMAMLQAISLIPFWGGKVDLSLGVIGSLCKVAKGRHTDGLKALGYALGKAAFGKLVKDKLIPGVAKGKWSPKFYRFLGIEPGSMNVNEAKAFGDALNNAYGVAVSALEAANWKPPKQ